MAVPPADDKAGGSGISQLPEQSRKRGRKAVAPARRKGDLQPGGPGGLGYVLALDDDEKAEIDWHAAETEAKAPPRRN